jgi:hypothetical protein
MSGELLRGCVRVKPGVTFTAISPAGFRLLAAIEGAARALRIELTITSACDGVHSGPDDPHHCGEAYDVRTHGFTEPVKDAIVFAIMRACADPNAGLPEPIPGIPRSRATLRFFGFIEGPGTPNEHIHVQLRRGRAYP